MFRRWHRFVALFILLWAVVDMTVPSLCESDGGFLLPVPQQQSSVSVDTDRGSQPATPAQEDDCFCCCSHISPTPHFEFKAVAFSEEYTAAAPGLQLLEFAEAHYHPPRV